MNELRALTPEQLARAEARLRSPAQGSRIEAAKRFGVDLGSLIVQLRLPPTERVSQMEAFSREMAAIRGAARKASRRTDS
jgi:hypothetical protein